MKLHTENRSLLVDMEDGNLPFRVLPSSETSGAGNNPDSKTYRWEANGKSYRVQLQVRDA